MASHPKTAWTGFLGEHGSSAGAGARRPTPTPVGISVAGTIEEFLEAARRGTARDRYNRPYGEEAVSELTWSLAGHAGERLGDADLGELRRRDLEALLYELGASGLSRRRLRAIAKSLRGLFDYAMAQGLVDHNPAERLALPDENDAEQPTRGRPRAPRLRIDVDRAIGLALQLASICFVLLALLFVAESL